MRKILILLVLLLFFSKSSAFAAGVPVTSTVLIPAFTNDGPYTPQGSWYTLWSYTAPSDSNVIMVAPVIKCTSYDGNSQIKIIADGTPIWYQGVYDYATHTFTPILIGSYSNIEIQALLESNGDLVFDLDPSTLTILSYGASEETVSQAKASADAAKTEAIEAKNNSWYTGSYGGGAESVGDIAGYIRNTQLPGLDTKVSNLDTKISSLQTTVNNIQTSDTIPPTIDLQTVSGARATSGSSIQAIVTVSDNKPGPFTYSINGGIYNSLPVDGLISLPVTAVGNNLITVSIKDVAGNIASKSVIIRKL